jgi:hypothetical protein
MLEDSFVDRERPTAANRDFPGALGSDELEGSVWYPLEAEAGAATAADLQPRLYLVSQKWRLPG